MGAAREAKLEDALYKLLRWAELNTCQHDDTVRGGVLWEICIQCGAQWADDKGGKPEWEDPEEWGAARRALVSSDPPVTDDPIRRYTQTDLDSLWRACRIDVTGLEPMCRDLKADAQIRLQRLISVGIARYSIGYVLMTQYSDEERTKVLATLKYGTFDSEIRFPGVMPVMPDPGEREEFVRAMGYEFGPDWREKTNVRDY